MFKIRRPEFSRRRALRRLIVAWAILSAGWLFVSTAIAYRLTHRIEARSAEPAPSLAWGRLESHRIATRDGEEIGAWFVNGQRRCPERAGAPRS